MLGKPTWAKQFLTLDFNTDYPTNRESGEGPITKRWMAQSRNWMKKFLTEIMHATEIEWHHQYFEWTMFAKIGEQWWYFSTGDCRFKVCDWLLVRTAKDNRDFTGGCNQQVRYNSNTFQYDLERILKPRRI